MQTIAPIIGFVISLLLMMAVPVFEDELSKGYRLVHYRLSRRNPPPLYRLFQHRPTVVEIAHKLLLVSLLVVPTWTAWNYLGPQYAPPLSVVLAILYRRSFKRLPSLLQDWDRRRIDKHASRLAWYLQTWTKRVETPETELMRERLEYLQSSRAGSPALSHGEIVLILRALSSRHDEIGRAATQLLESLEPQ